MELNLSEIREEINEIDREIVELFKRRMACASSVAQYKAEHDLPVFDPERERALLTKICNMAGEGLDNYALTLYNTMLDVSKAYQHKILNAESVIYKQIKASLNSTKKEFPARAHVACQGVEGAYSQIAATKLFSLPDISFYKTFENVFEAIERGECDYGVLPIENSTAGSVKKVYELMLSHNFNIVRSVRLKIDHNLLVNQGVSIDDITEIISHEQAISQCAGFLSKHPSIKVTVCQNTAMAAKLVKESGRRDLAAISSRSCGELYSLTNIAPSIQDSGNNHTRFICISKKPEIYPGADKLTLMLVTKNRPGELYRALSCFNALGIDMTKLESSPIPDRDFEFMFYFDFTVSVYSERLRDLLCELEARGEDFKLLGAYNEII
jgi:chorismate mutase/prephenate dehydratase